MSGPDARVEAEYDVPLRENLGGWLRITLVAATLLLLPMWIFVVAALLERTGLVADPVALILAGVFAAAVVIAVVPLPLLLLAGGAAIGWVQDAWGRRRQRSVDAAVDREAVLVGVTIRSRVEGVATRSVPEPPSAIRADDLAPVELRIAAVLVDGLASNLVVGLTGGAGMLAGTAFDDPNAALGAVIVGTCVGAGAVTIGQAVGLSLVGQSLGKWLLGIRIVGDDGREVGFVDAFLVRSFGWSLLLGVPLVGTLLLLADVWALLTSRHRQSLHDQLARTLVVRVREVRRRAARPASTEAPERP